jgi:hypothetical protein
MKRRNVAIITAFLAVAIILIAAIVTMAGAWKSDPTPRPCLTALRPNDVQTLRTYAASIPDAETIADGVDVICVLEAADATDSPDTVMHYYEDDDGFADFVPYALATAHARQISGHRQISGTPDAAQWIALQSLVMVQPNGKIWMSYRQNGPNWLVEDSPVAHPGYLVTHVRYGNAAPIKISKANGQTPPNQYRKGTISNAGAAYGNFEDASVAALILNTSDDDHRVNGRPGTSPSVAPSSTQQGSPTPASSRANPATPKASATPRARRS